MDIQNLCNLLLNISYIKHFNGFQPDKEGIQNKSSTVAVDEANSFVDEIEMVQKEEAEGFSALHTPTAIDAGDDSESLDEDFESSDERFLDTIKCEPVSIPKCDFLFKQF